MGIVPCTMEEFLSSEQNAILGGSDAERMNFARQHLGYTREKGLDFVGRFSGQYIIGEAKFLTDFGGHQNAQFADALSTLRTPSKGCIHIAILDGVLYIPTASKPYKQLTEECQEEYIMSALVLRNFLYSIS